MPHRAPRRGCARYAPTERPSTATSSVPACPPSRWSASTRRTSTRVYRRITGTPTTSSSWSTWRREGARLLLADEPTSQLDPASAEPVVELLRWAKEQLGTTVVVVTHDPVVGAAFDRTLTIRDGRVGMEGRDGQEYVVVGRDGSVQLPPHV
ncbi:hypothetical protein ACFQ07_15830, partial [Actinomadura adrarensis]